MDGGGSWCDLGERFCFTFRFRTCMGPNQIVFQGGWCGCGPVMKNGGGLIGLVGGWGGMR